MTPPRIATWLLRVSLSEPERVYVIGDMVEELAARAARDPRAARRWYWSQVIRSLPRNLARRLRRARSEGRREATRRGVGASGRDAAGLLGSLSRDAAYSLRLLSAQPGRSIVLVLTIALGIGTNLALFAVVNGVVLRSLPYPDPARLIRLWDRHDDSGLSYFSVSVPHYLAWRQRLGGLVSVGAYREDGFSLAGADGARPIDGVRMTATLFDVLGFEPLLGRAFTGDEDRSGGPPVAVATYGFWRRELGGDPDAVGRPFLVDGEPRTLVGVMPEGFRFPQQERAELLVPYALVLEPENRMAHFLRVLGRLRQGATLEVVLEQSNAIARRLEADDPGVETGWTVVGLPLHEEIVGEVSGTLFLLQGAGLLVLLIAVVNVAILLMVRGSGRAREMALRATLGAPAGRLVRQALTESLVLAALGSAAGVGLAAGALSFGRTWLPDSLPRAADLGIDATTIAVAVTLTLLVGLLFGLAPALHAVRQQSPGAGVSGRGGWGSARTVAGGGVGGRRVLVTLQMSLAALLLSSAALLVQSSLRLAAVDPGFEAHGALSFDLRPKGEAYATTAARARLYARVQEDVSTLPGVQAVGLTHRLPLTGNSWLGFRIVGQDGPEGGYNANYRAISGGYFAAMGIPLVAGRTFSDAETWERGGVVIVNQAAARQFWGGRSPVGERIGAGSGGTPPLEVVGVAADSRESGLGDEVEPAVYLPYAVAPVPGATIVVRADVEPGSLSVAITRTVAGIDSSLAVAGLQTLDDFVDALLVQPRFNSGLASLFAVLAVVLAAVGISGVIGWLVASRHRELGIRLALGDRPSRILGRLLGEGLAIASGGLLLGLAVSVLAGRLLRSLLFGVTPGDPRTLAGVALTLLCVAALATLMPARRILRLDPARTLRE